MDTIARVEELLAERHLSLFQLSQMSDVAYSTFSNSKRRAGQLTVSTIERVCGALGISLSEFFTVPESSGGKQ